MSEEESYLDSLLKALTKPEAEGQPTGEIQTNVVIQDITNQEEMPTQEETSLEEHILEKQESMIDAKTQLEEAILDTTMQKTEEKPDFGETADVEQGLSFEDLSNDTEIEIPDGNKKEENQEVGFEAFEMPETEFLETNTGKINLEDFGTEAELQDAMPEDFESEEKEQSSINTSSEDFESEEKEQSSTNTSLEEMELTNINPMLEDQELLRLSETEEKMLEESELPDINITSEELEDLETEITKLSDTNEILKELEDLDTEFPEKDAISEKLNDFEAEEALSDINTAKEQGIIELEADTDLEEQEDIETGEIELADVVGIGMEPEANEEIETGELELSDMGAISEDNGGELEMPEIPDELNLDGLEEAITSETAFQMAEELNMEDLGMEDLDSDVDVSDIPDIPDEAENLDLLGGMEADEMSSVDSDDNLEDVLSMLDNDTELAEINDMLKKSDNNEPIEDDMMSLLNQMADDESASVNAGVKDVEDDDGGVPLPELPKSVAEQLEEDAKDNGKKKKDKHIGTIEDMANAKEDSGKKSGKLGKFFNMLTEELVPEPTEEELAAEKEAKEAKKQEELTKKQQEKLEKEEAKKAKAEEKEAAKKAKAEAAQKKNKEKQAAKEKKAAEKRAKQAGEKKEKRIPPKKIAAAAVFGASVGGAILISTKILSEKGYLQTAKNAFYQQDYMTVYQSTYGMELDSSASDGLIQARSEVILKIKRRYDSYQTNLKMGRKLEALDALIQGLATYDFINAEAEQYEVIAEVDAIKEQILNTLQENYGLDEAAARELLGIEDALQYTIALSDIIEAANL